VNSQADTPQSDAVEAKAPTKQELAQREIVKVRRSAIIFLMMALLNAIGLASRFAREFDLTSNYYQIDVALLVLNIMGLVGSTLLFIAFHYAYLELLADKHSDSHSNE